LVPGLLLSRQSLNSGALFGSFSGWVGVFIVASVLALAFVLYFFACSHRRQWFMHVGLAFILAGALGNLYDRAFVQADIVTLKGGSQHIGLIVSDDGANPVVLANYPDRTREEHFPPTEIAAIDRHGVVRDFLKFKTIAGFDYWPWVFNVADALLVAGVAVLLLTSWREHRAAKAEREQSK
jgi:lipoprotein signal peptidase